MAPGGFHGLCTCTRIQSPRPCAQVPDLSAFTALRHLELSYNAIRSLAPLAACGATGLQELYAASNKITEVCSLGLRVHC